MTPESMFYEGMVQLYAIGGITVVFFVGAFAAHFGWWLSGKTIGWWFEAKQKAKVSK
jgi:hypothetical protein